MYWRRIIVGEMRTRAQGPQLKKVQNESGDVLHDTGNLTDSIASFTSENLPTSVDISAFHRAIFSVLALSHYLEHAAMIF